MCDRVQPARAIVLFAALCASACSNSRESPAKSVILGGSVALPAAWVHEAKPDSLPFIGVLYSGTKAFLDSTKSPGAEVRVFRIRPPGNWSSVAREYAEASLRTSWKQDSVAQWSKDTAGAVGLASYHRGSGTKRESLFVNYYRAPNDLEGAWFLLVYVPFVKRPAGG